MENLRKVKERFRSYVSVDLNKCWIWFGGLCKGYAQFALNGNSVRAARWIYELVNGPIPEGYDLHHTCFVKKCVSPYHLVPVTHREHAQIHAKLGAWAGLRNGNTKRTEIEVLTIKFCNQHLMLPASHIAKVMGIPRRSVYSITRGEVWNHLQLPDKSELEKELRELRW